MKQTLLDTVQGTWWQENRRDIFILSAMALVAIGLIVGIFIFIRNKRRKNKTTSI